MSAEALTQIGAVLGCVGAATFVLARPRAVRLAGLAAWALGLALFLPLLAPSGQRALLVAGAVVALLVVAGLAVLLVRAPWLLPLLVLAAAPARIPVAVGDTSANLLVPLYGVVAAAAAALAWEIWRESSRSRELGLLSWPVALLVAWFGVSETWSGDVRSGAIMLFFYVLPFVVLAVALARLRWSAGRVDLARGLLLGMAVLFAAVGVWQWATHGVFWNDRVIEGNANAAFYRVNSLFWDPSIYGRFLVLAILVALAAVLFGRRAGTRADLAYTAAMALLWAGLVVSFSQSSFVALAAGIVVAAFVAWRWRALAAVVLAAVVMVPVGFAAPQLGEVRDNLADSSATRLTSYRSTLVGVGFDIWRDHPVAGVGLGGFNTAYVREERDPTVPAEGASHTTPVTVAAETGVIGFAFYVWLLGALVVLAFRGADVTTAMGRARVVAGICFVAIAVHSLFYSAFFEDPLMWGFAALVVVAARAAPPAGPTREAV